MHFKFNSARADLTAFNSYTMAPKLYSFYGSPVVRAVFVAAKALEVALDVEELNFVEEDHLKPEYLKINPQHTAPTLDDDGFILWDSHAIMGYLVGKYGKDDSLYPKDIRKRALIDQRLHFESGTLFPLLRAIDYGYLRKEFKEVPARIKDETIEAYGFLEKFLEDHRFAVGNEATIADFSLYCTLSSLDYHINVDGSKFPNVAAWMERVQELACFTEDLARLIKFKEFFDEVKSAMK